MSWRASGNEVGEAGFTLVELLAAMALFSLISVMLLQTLNFAFKARERGTAHASRVDELYVVHDFVRRIIEDAYPHLVGADPTRRHVDFEGTADKLTLLASAPRALGSGGRLRIVLAMIKQGSKADLTLTSDVELGAAVSQPTSKALVANAALIEFSYFGRRRSDRAPEWKTQWVGETAPPKLVRVRVQFPSGDAREWPELVVGPRIAVDVSCTYDPLSKQCRGR